MRTYLESLPPFARLYQIFVGHVGVFLRKLVPSFATRPQLKAKDISKEREIPFPPSFQWHVYGPLSLWVSAQLTRLPTCGIYFLVGTFHFHLSLGLQPGLGITGKSDCVGDIYIVKQKL